MSESRKATRSARRRIEPLFKSVAPGGAGAMPGSPIYIGDKAPTEAALSLIQYDTTDISFVTPEHIEEVFAMLEDGMVNWINVNGLGDQDAIKRLAGYYRLDPLTVEDILNTEHRPKIEDFGSYILVITKMLTRRDDDSIEYEQVSIVITRNSVLTFRKAPGTVLTPYANDCAPALEGYGGPGLRTSATRFWTSSWTAILPYLNGSGSSWKSLSPGQRRHGRPAGSWTRCRL